MPPARVRRGEQTTQVRMFAGTEEREKQGRFAPATTPTSRAPGREPGGLVAGSEAEIGEDHRRPRVGQEPAVDGRAQGFRGQPLVLLEIHPRHLAEDGPGGIEQTRSVGAMGHQEHGNRRLHSRSSRASILSRVF
jgi:hypothetical protein